MNVRNDKEKCKQEKID